MMRRIFLTGLAVLAAASASAAPNVTNASQKGSLLIFPDIRIDDEAGQPWNTLIRIQNDGGMNVDVVCYWMDGNKNRTDVAFEITKDQPFWFDARTGTGTHHVNPFPQTVANGFDNPYLLTPPATDEASDGPGLYYKGLLACWVTDPGHQNQVKWNHLSGTATVYHPTLGAYEYNAYAFFAPQGLDMQPIGVAGALKLDGMEYDWCPLYQIGQFTPIP